MNSSNIPAVWHGYDGVETGWGIGSIGYSVSGVGACAGACVGASFEPFKPSVIILFIFLSFFYYYYLK